MRRLRRIAVRANRIAGQGWLTAAIPGVFTGNEVKRRRRGRRVAQPRDDFTNAMPAGAGDIGGDEPWGTYS